jgi:hypothetical protein
MLSIAPLAVILEPGRIGYLVNTNGILIDLLVGRLLSR